MGLGGLRNMCGRAIGSKRPFRVRIWRINGEGLEAFGSSHPCGACFCFADGSVHFLPAEIDGTTLERLAARNDGMPVADFQ